jgi:cytochrome P450
VQQIATVKKEIDEGRDKSKHKTIFHQLLDPKASEGYVVPDVEALTEEMFTVLTAGGETTGHALAMTTYYVLSKADIRQKLVSELKSAFPNKKADLEYLTLEKLPYLSCVIKEGLRLSYGVPGRLPRVIEAPDATFNGYRVPKGTIVSMSTWMLHRDPKNFPEPEQFIPERWSDPAKSRTLENKYFAPFGRGSRQCVGMQYATLFPLPFLERYPHVSKFYVRARSLTSDQPRISRALHWNRIYLSQFRPPSRRQLRPCRFGV